MPQPPASRIRQIKAALFAACLLPVSALAARAWAGALGANPIEAVTRSTGWWTLVLLLVTLSITPLRRLLAWPWLLRLRRMLGLFAFSYGVMHLATYLWFDQFFDWPEIVRDIAKRPFVTVGFAAFVLMVPLAATSTNAMVRRLGAARWQALHRAVYFVAILGVVHFWWLVKKDIREPAAFALMLSVLLGWRVAQGWRERRRNAGRGSGAPAEVPSGRAPTAG